MKQRRAEQEAREQGPSDTPAAVPDEASEPADILATVEDEDVIF